MLADVSLQLTPGSFRVPDLLAVGADRKQSFKRFHLRKRGRQLADKSLAFTLSVLAVRDVREVDRKPTRSGWINVELQPAAPRLKIALELDHAAAFHGATEHRFHIGVKQFRELIKNWLPIQ